MDSTRVIPKPDEADGNEDEDVKQPESARYSLREEHPNLELLLRNTSMRSGHLKKFVMMNHRISPNRLFTIAVKLDALKEKQVRKFYASLVADAGTAG